MIVGKIELDKKLSKLADNKTIQKALNEACVIVEASAKMKCPKDEGVLRNSITWEVEGTTGAVGTNWFYAPYVHQGTGIHARYGLGRQEPWGWPATPEQVNKYGIPIPDKPGKYYNASKDKNGQWRIWTHGQEPHPFLEQALDENKLRINEAFIKAIKEALND